MIPVQLPSGKTVFLEASDYLDMLDSNNGFSDLIANDYGYEINDPFSGSSIDKKKEELNEEEIILLHVPLLDDIENLNMEED